ncbi:receptor-type tyrosine-protein phosphatase S-like [Mercenaria mercenaria]|uniref:receptor-type tyrosine-protein phosphatase S-like n=1 Tax=Mercenaria mercenaria TaxID=6596 RepID=UPI00234F3979|nr:receptor-type tyrosine-protein phosphatase S-like [Mercenaria mercenaria]
MSIVSIKRNNKQTQRLSENKRHNAVCPESSASNDDNHPTHCLSKSTAEYATIERKHPDTMFQEGTAECAETFDDHIYFNEDEVMKRKIPLDQLREFVQNKTIDNYVEEFKELPSGLIKPHKASQKRENILKNRYRDIYPYDSKRVILREGKSDYINASYIDGYMKQRAYIASMGPTIKQMGADFDVFWNMVWQERVDKIVMLTNLRESGVQKCDKYWPDEGCCNKYGHVKVMCQVEEIYANYTARIFTMEKTERRTLYQMHFTVWPDKSTPQQVSSLTDFWEKVKGISTTEDGPMIVHCSAGVGRTGTYIALDILANEGMSEGHVDVFACVRNLREERVCLVQTVGQYRFLHEALLQILSPDNTNV